MCIEVEEQVEGKHGVKFNSEVPKQPILVTIVATQANSCYTSQ